MPRVPNSRAERLPGQTSILYVVVVGGAVGIAGCGGVTPVPGPTPPANRCIIAAEPVDAPAPITIGFTESVDPEHALRPRSASEQVLFRMLYESLVGVDCAGRVFAGLAHSWRSEEQGRVWVFTVRDDASFWDGSPATAHDVVASWRAHPPPGGLVSPDSVSALDDRIVRVGLTSAHTSAATFAAPALAVLKARPGRAWPTGTSGFEVVLAEPTRGALVRIHPRNALPPLLEYTFTGTADARDFLDYGVDVLVTNDPSALDYAETRPSDFTIAPLPWSKTYVLLAPGWGERRDATAPPRGLLDEIARDAVRAEARGAQPPFWWEATRNCASASPSIGRVRVRNPASARRVAYPQHDPVARDIAERLVALAGSRVGSRQLDFLGADWSRRGTEFHALGLSGGEFTESLGRGGEGAYVFALPRVPWDGCAEAFDLRTRIPWLSADSDAAQGLTGSLVPLVDVRLRAVMRRGRVGAYTEWDGTLRIMLP